MLSGFVCVFLPPRVQVPNTPSRFYQFIIVSCGKDEKTKKRPGLAHFKRCLIWAAVVAQLAERLLLTPEVCGSNPVIGKIYNEHLFNVNCVEKTKIKKKVTRNGQLKKIYRLNKPKVKSPSLRLVLHRRKYGPA